MSGNANQIFSGARAVLYFGDNNPVGFATNCSGGEDIEYVPIVTLNSIQVREFVPVGYAVSFSASRVFLQRDSLKLQTGPGGNPIFPLTTADAVQHLRNVFAAGGDDGLTIQIIDSVSGEVFMLLEGASITSRSWSFGARDIVGEDVTFVAIRMFDQNDANNAGQAGIAAQA